MQKPQWMDDTGELIASLSLSFAKLLCHLVLLSSAHGSIDDGAEGE